MSSHTIKVSLLACFFFVLSLIVVPIVHGQTSSVSPLAKVSIVAGLGPYPAGNGPYHSSISSTVGASQYLGWFSYDSNSAIIFGTDKPCTGTASPADPLFSGSYVATGNVWVSPTVSTTYTITCGGVSDYVMVNIGTTPAQNPQASVNTGSNTTNTTNNTNTGTNTASPTGAPCSIDSFTEDPATFVMNQPLNFHWSVSNPSGCDQLILVKWNAGSSWPSDINLPYDLINPFNSSGWSSGFILPFGAPSSSFSWPSVGFTLQSGLLNFLFGSPLTQPLYNAQVVGYALGLQNLNKTSIVSFSFNPASSNGTNLQTPDTTPTQKWSLIGVRNIPNVANLPFYLIQHLPTITLQNGAFGLPLSTKTVTTTYSTSNACIITSFMANPVTITTQGSTLSWSNLNCTGASLTGPNGASSSLTNGSLFVVAPGTYTLTMQPGNITQNVTVGGGATSNSGYTTSTCGNGAGQNPCEVVHVPNTFVTGNQCLEFQTSIQKGSSGSDVVSLQDFLRTQGFLNGVSTGYFGPITGAAVKAFQSANNIDSIGTVGPQTRAKIADITCNGGTSDNNKPTVHLQVNGSDGPVTITVGEAGPPPIAVTWTSSGATSCSAPWTYLQTSSGSVFINFNGGTLSITCSNSSGLKATGSVVINSTNSSNITVINTASTTINDSINKPYVPINTGSTSTGGGNTQTQTSYTSNTQSSSNGCIDLQSNLGYGLRDTDVVSLQNYLISKGYLASGNNGGFYGRLTVAAVKAYQSASGLYPVSGFTGPLTRNMVRFETCGTKVTGSQNTNPNSNTSTNTGVSSSIQNANTIAASYVTPYFQVYAADGLTPTKNLTTPFGQAILLPWGMYGLNVWTCTANPGNVTGSGTGVMQLVSTNTNYPASGTSKTYTLSCHNTVTGQNSTDSINVTTSGGLNVGIDVSGQQRGVAYTNAFTGAPGGYTVDLSQLNQTSGLQLSWIVWQAPTLPSTVTCTFNGLPSYNYWGARQASGTSGYQGNLFLHAVPTPTGVYGNSARTNADLFGTLPLPTSGTVTDSITCTDTATGKSQSASVTLNMINGTQTTTGTSTPASTGPAPVVQLQLSGSMGSQPSNGLLTLAQGESFILKWNSDIQQSCDATTGICSGCNLGPPFNSSLPIRMNATYAAAGYPYNPGNMFYPNGGQTINYSLTCNTATGNSTTDRVSVKGSSNPDGTSGLVAYPTSFTPGGTPPYLSWWLPQTGGCTATNDAGDYTWNWSGSGSQWAGAQVESPTKTTTYKLTCSNTTVKTAIITVGQQSNAFTLSQTASILSAIQALVAQLKGL